MPGTNDGSFSGCSNPSTVLGLGLGASQDDIRAAYKKRALETHPDKGGDPEEFLRVRRAYEALTKAAEPAARGLAATVFESKAPPVPPRPKSRSTDAPPWFAQSKPDSEDAAKAWEARVRSPPRPPAPMQKPASPKKRRKTIEEEINSAFQDIPINRPARPARPQAKKSAPAATPKKFTSGQPISEADKDAARKRVAAMPAAELWASLAKLTPEQRAQAISALDAQTHTRLKDFLLAKKRHRLVTEIQVPKPVPKVHSPPLKVPGTKTGTAGLQAKNSKAKSTSSEGSDSSSEGEETTSHSSSEGPEDDDDVSVVASVDVHAKRAKIASPKASAKLAAARSKKASLLASARDGVRSSRETACT